MISSRLLEADLLYQMDAHELAAQRLESLARETAPESTRLAALSRLTEIACDAGELEAARRNLAEMRRSAEQLGAELAPADRAELIFATARYAYSRRDGAELQHRAPGAGERARRIARDTHQLVLGRRPLSPPGPHRRGRCGRRRHQADATH